MNNPFENEGNYAIAYADKNGKGFSDTKPWIDNSYGDDLKECMKRAEEMNKLGFKNIVIFKFGKRKREEYSWKYVRMHKI